MTRHAKSDCPLPRNLTRFYLKYLFAHPWWMVGFVVALVCARVGQYSIEPLFGKYVIDWIQNPPAQNVLGYALPYLILMLAVCAIVHVGWVLRYYFETKIETFARANISADLQDYVNSQSISFYSKTEPGKISRNIDYIIDGFYEYLLHGVVSFMITLTTAFVSFVLLVRVSLILALIFIAMTIISVLWTAYDVTHYSRAAAAYADKNSDISGRLNDSLSNFITVKLFAGARRERAALSPLRNGLARLGMRLNWADARFWVPSSYLMDASIIMCFGISIYLATSGKMSAGDVVFAIMTYERITTMLFDALMSSATIVKVFSSARTAYRELNRPMQLVDAPDAGELNVPHGGIELRNVSFKFRDEWVLHNLNLKINPGEHVGIVGLSGAGKTTLVRLVMRFYDPHTGNILIDNTDIRTVHQDSLRRNISFVPQDETMFNRTLAQNIGYGNPGAKMSDIINAARQSNSYDFIMATDKQFNTIVGTRGIKLSGGQRQRIAIARAFLKDAPILIMDEATSALDSEAEAKIQQSLQKLAHGRTTIVIAHRLATLKSMDRIIVLDHGKIVESGTHNELIKRRHGLYKKLWQRQNLT